MGRKKKLTSICKKNQKSSHLTSNKKLIVANEIPFQKIFTTIEDKYKRRFVHKIEKHCLIF